MPALSLVLSLIACAPTSSAPSSLDPGEQPSPEEDTATDEETDALTDEDVLRAAIDDPQTARDALDQIALSDGLPIQTREGRFLFACLCGDGAWSLAGDHNGWAPEPMNRDGELWWLEADIEDPDGSLYKFTDGARWIADPLARRYGYDAFGEFSLVRASAAHLERWPGISAAGLQPRALQIWVPEDGDFTHLLIAQDGQNLFDPAAIWGGWRLQESVPDDMLIVGIANTSDRFDEYTMSVDRIGGEVVGGRGEAYAELVDVVLDLAVDAYGPAAVTGVMGSSLGGLIAFELMLLRPEQFDMAISLSGTMGWGSIGMDEPTVFDRLASAGRPAARWYLDSGGGGGCRDDDGDGLMDDDPAARDNYCTNIQLRDALESSGYSHGKDLWHWYAPEAPHTEAAWAARVDRPLQIFGDL